MFAEIKNNTVVTFPYNYDSLIKANPYTNFDNSLTLLEMYKGTESNLSGCSLVRVKIDPDPVVDEATQELVLDSMPTYRDGSWVLSWTFNPLTTEQQLSRHALKAATVRETRTQRLKDSDWTQVADAPVDKAAWAIYRQALRDVPSQAGFPWDVQWPTQPE